MPLFEYRCRSCHWDFEVLVRGDEDLPEQCPSCGTPQPERKFSTFAAHTTTAAAGRTAPCGGNPQSCESGGCPYV